MVANIEGTWKNIKLEVSEFSKRLSSLVKSINSNAIIESNSSKTNEYSFEISIPNNNKALIKVWDKTEGLTILSSQGSNKKLSTQLTAKILENTNIVENQKVLSFPGIPQKTLNEIMLKFDNNEPYLVERPIVRDNLEQIIIKINAYKITLNYYPTTDKLVFTGYGNNLWDEVYLEIKSKLTSNPEDIIQEYIDNRIKLQNLQIKYDSGIVEQLIQEKLTSEVYNNNKIITKTEKLWLNTSAFFQFTEIQLDEYYPTVASSIKIIEGLLNRIFINKNQKQEELKEYFEPNTSKTTYILKNYYKSYFGNKETTDLIENMYMFQQKHRNPLSHNNGINAVTLTKKEDALAIFQEIIRLLKQAHEKTDYLF